MAQVTSKAGSLVCLAIFLGWCTQFLCPAADGVLEYQVKAVFLLNFTKFIEWPAAAFAQPEAPMTICILGADPFGAAINEIVSGEIVNGRRIAVQRMKQIPGPKSCQVLFLGRAEGGAGKSLSEMGLGVLTVGEGESFVREGGMIAFIMDNRRVRFDVNQAAAERAGLKISSKLLSVARDVQRGSD